MFTVALAVNFFFFFQSLQPVTIAVMEVFFYVYSCFKNKLYSSSTVLILISSFQVFNAVSYSFKCLKCLKIQKVAVIHCNYYFTFLDYYLILFSFLQCTIKATVAPVTRSSDKR